MNNKLDQKKFDDIYFEGIPMKEKINGGTFNVVYMREYIDPENECETFGAYETIYRNVPNKYRSKFDNEKMKMKMSRNFRECLMAKNVTPNPSWAWTAISDQILKQPLRCFKRRPGSVTMAK